MPKVVVLGGAVMDLVFQLREMPAWKQAVQAHSFRMFPGGKGLNQAVAAAKLGAEVSLISAVGGDEFGERLLDALGVNKISSEFVRKVPGTGTAVTSVLVNYQAEAAFIGWKSVTNSHVNSDLVRQATDQIRQADAILITLEVSSDAVEEAISIAKERGTLVVLNPAPPFDPPERLAPAVLRNVKLLAPNVWEAQRLLGQEGDAETLAIRLHRMGPEIVCVTTSELGCVVATEGRVKPYEPFSTTPVDTTGGSDAFCAAFAISLLEKKPVEEAIWRANAAGAVAVGKLGGSPSMPSPKEIDDVLKTRQYVRASNSTSGR